MRTQARGQDDEDEDVGGIQVRRGRKPGPMARQRNKRVYMGLHSRTAREAACARRHETRNRQDDTQMFAAGRVDTIYLLLESPSGHLSRDASYLRVPS